ncbi:ribonuclease P protein component [Arhodomonas sp. AD133]|uniref:ribonuclease P protein component n=1 Tax=Arhodomonas sp. AD133 TaxID=3415009 RepID=UPI003EC1438B
MRTRAGRGAARFPRAARLTDSRAFGQVFRGAERLADKHFTVLFRRRSDHPEADARLGMAVSRRVAPRAVDRNRIKRMVREAFRHRRHELPAVDVVVIARGAARGAAGPRLQKSMVRLLERMQRQCDGS